MHNPAELLLAEFANLMMDAHNPKTSVTKTEVEAKRAELLHMLNMQWEGLENCRYLAQRSPSASWAQSVLRFCAEAGSVPRPLGR